MRRNISGPLPLNPRAMMQRIGYGEHRGRDTYSYAKRIHGTPYPRFHAYIEERGDGMSINLHLDQKQASYEGSHAHSGEYEGSAVEREMDRIVALIEQLKRAPVQVAVAEEPEKKKRGLFGLLFG